MKKPRFKYPSVTEVLEPYVDLSMVKPEVLEAAQTRGKIVHNVCHGYAKYQIAINVPEKYLGYIESFKYFYRDIEEIEMLEDRIFNDGILLCGQADLVAKRYDDKLPRVWDLKTPVSVYSTWKAQISAYKWLYEQKTGRLTDMPGHVRLKENGKRPIVNILTPDEYKKELDVFFKALTCYHHYA